MHFDPVSSVHYTAPPGAGHIGPPVGLGQEEEGLQEGVWGSQEGEQGPPEP